MPVNRKKGSKRYGQRYTVRKDGAHVYKSGAVVGGKKKPKDPYASQVDAATKLEFGDTDLQIDRERRIHGQANLNVGDWWQGYKNDVESARQRQAQGYQQAQQSVYNQANTARAQDQSQAAQMDAEAQRQAALRGATAGPNVAAQAQASRAALNNSYGGLIGSQGASQNAYMADQGRIAGGIRALELGKEASRGRQVEEQARSVAAKKGAFKAAKRDELEKAAWTRFLEEKAYQVKEADFKLKQYDTLADNSRLSAKDSLDARDKRTKNKLKKVDQNIKIRGQDLTDARSRRKGSGKSGPRHKAGYGRTNVSESKGTTARQQWLNLINTGGSKPPKGANAYLVKVAKEYYRGHKKVSKRTALRVWRDFGFRIPYEKPGKVGKGVKRGYKVKPFKGF